MWWADNCVKHWRNLPISNPKPDILNINACTMGGLKLKSLDIYTSYCPEKKNIGVSPADNSVKIWWNLPISNPKPNLYNINAHTKFGENSLMFTQVITRKPNMDGQTYLRDRCY